MSNHSCPVPGCSRTGFARQTKVNRHLRIEHKIAIPLRRGGDMKKLQTEQQQNFFEDWLETQGYDYNIDLCKNHITPKRDKSMTTKARLKEDVQADLGEMLELWYDADVEGQYKEAKERF